MVKKIMFDSNVYDDLYDLFKCNNDLYCKMKILQENKVLEFCTTPIQHVELNKINLNKYPEKEEKKKFSLRVQSQQVGIPPLFSYDVPGAGYGEGKYANQEETRLYNLLNIDSPKPEKHIHDKLIGIAANWNVDVLVTMNKKHFQKNKDKFSNIQIWVFEKFKKFIEKI